MASLQGELASARASLREEAAARKAGDDLNAELLEKLEARSCSPLPPTCPGPAPDLPRPASPLSLSQHPLHAHAHTSTHSHSHTHSHAHANTRISSPPLTPCGLPAMASTLRSPDDKRRATTAGRRPSASSPRARRPRHRSTARPTTRRPLPSTRPPTRQPPPPPPPRRLLRQSLPHRSGRVRCELSFLRALPTFLPSCAANFPSHHNTCVMSRAGDRWCPALTPWSAAFAHTLTQTPFPSLPLHLSVLPSPLRPARSLSRSRYLSGYENGAFRPAAGSGSTRDGGGLRTPGDARFDNTLEKVKRALAKMKADVS